MAGEGNYSEKLLQLIDWMLAPAIQNRPQNVAQVMSILEQGSEVKVPGNTEASVPKQEVRSTMATVVVTEKSNQKTNEKISNKHEDFLYQFETIQNIPILWLIITSICILILVVINIGKKQPMQPMAELTLTPIEAAGQELLLNKQSQSKRALEELERQDQPKQPSNPSQQVASLYAVSAQHTLDQQFINTLLTQAATDIQQLRLTSPKGNNAFDKYQQVLQLDPENQAVQQGYTIIVETYLQLAKNAQYKQDYARATRLINKARKVQSGNPKIYLAKEQLKLAQANEQAELVKTKKQWQPLGEISDFFKTIFPH